MCCGSHGFALKPFFVTSLGELSSESTWLQQTVHSSLTKKFQNGDSTKPDSTPRSLPNTVGFQTNHHGSSRTIVEFKLAQHSRRKEHNNADSPAHSQAGSQACRCLGWQNRGVSGIGEASPASSTRKQNNFYSVPNCLVLFHHDPNKRYDTKISVLSEPTTKLFLRCTSIALFPYMVR